MSSLIIDIDGVVLHGNEPTPGAADFVQTLIDTGRRFLFLTNYPSQTPKELSHRFESAGVPATPERFYTSAMATAAFLERQQGRKAFVIGEGALAHALYTVGFTITDINPDLVVVGETRAYNWEMIHKAARFVKGGAQFIATNPDIAGPGQQPACGALCAPIERITGRAPFYVGKPSAWIMRAALNSMDAHSEDSVIIGDNMATDIMAGTQAGMTTVLVLSGVTAREDIEQFPYRPQHVYDKLSDVDCI